MNVTYQFVPTESENDNNIIIAIHEKWKFQIMWALREFEAEINSSGGGIIIKSEVGNCDFDVYGFSDELTYKIYELLMEVDFQYPFQIAE